MRVTLDEACELIRKGEVVAIPTETVYGLAASYHNTKAVEKIFQLKQRPEDKPLSLLFSKFDQVHPLVEYFPADFLKLKNFMPGPLTVVLTANCASVPDIVRAGGDSVGLRMPNHALTLKLLDRVGPLAVPSANPSGLPPAKSAFEVEAYFDMDFPVLDGGVCEIGQASTVVKLDKTGFTVLRQGRISLSDLKSST